MKNLSMRRIFSKKNQGIHCMEYKQTVGPKQESFWKKMRRSVSFVLSLVFARKFTTQRTLPVRSTIWTSIGDKLINYIKVTDLNGTSRKENIFYVSTGNFPVSISSKSHSWCVTPTSVGPRASYADSCKPLARRIGAEAGQLIAPARPARSQYYLMNQQVTTESNCIRPHHDMKQKCASWAQQKHERVSGVLLFLRR